MESSNINSNVTPTMTTASGQRVILNLQTKLPLNGKKEKEFKTTFNTTSSPTLFLNKLQKMTHNQYARKKGKERVPLTNQVASREKGRVAVAKEAIVAP